MFYDVWFLLTLNVVVKCGLFSRSKYLEYISRIRNAAMICLNNIKLIKWCCKIYCHSIKQNVNVWECHSWASALRKLMSASAFRHQFFQSGTGPKKCWTELTWSSTGPFMASLVFSFRYRTDQMPDSPAFILMNTHMNTHTNTHTNMHSHMHTDLWWTGENMDRNMDVQHGHEAWTWTCIMNMEMYKHHRCRNADKKFSLASLVFR